MNEGKGKERISRRRFLQGVGLGTGAAGVAVAWTAAATRPAQAARPRRPVAGYRETEHVRQAYALSRF